MSFGIQPIHIVFIFIVALLVFGPKRLPEVGRNIGKALNEFRRMTSGLTDIINSEAKEPSIMPPRSNAPLINTVLPTPQSPGNTQTPPITMKMTENYCIACGAANISDARYCNKCGTKLPEKAT